MKIKKSLILVPSLLAIVAFASTQEKEKIAPQAEELHDESELNEHEGHEHEKEEGHKHDQNHEDKHDDEAKHDHEEGEHGHEDEENSSVGPTKGIVTADEENGIKLSPEAIKNFELRTVVLKGASPWVVPGSAILYSGEEINVYRLRDGFYKRIDFILLGKQGELIQIKGKELSSGDEIVVHGVGFLRTAELVAFGGAPEGHSH